MKYVGDALLRQGNKILNDKQYALLCVAIFAILPVFSWLSAAIVALITLRKGKEAGLNILLPAMVTSLVYMYTMLPLELALVNVLVRWLPVFLGACILRDTGSWSYVFGSFFLLILVSALSLQLFFPDLVLAQYKYFQIRLSSFPEFVQLSSTQNTWDTEILAHLSFGILVVLSSFSVGLSLLFARYMQGKLFFPGGFKKEIMAFRSGKCALMTFSCILVLAWSGLYLAVDVLPLMFFYFLLSGIGLLFSLIEKRKVLGITVFLILLIVNSAALMVPLIVICAVLGILDSLFNFRIYFSARTC